MLTIVNNYICVPHSVNWSRQFDHRFSTSLCVCVFFMCDDYPRFWIFWEVFVWYCLIITNLFVIDHHQKYGENSSIFYRFTSYMVDKNMFTTYMSIFSIYFYRFTFTPKKSCVQRLRLCGAWGALAAPPVPPKPTVRLATEKGVWSWPGFMSY